MILEVSRAFPVVVRGRREYHGELVRLRRARASGIYAIIDRGGRVRYVGESHSGRLYDTITRHFRQWSLDPDQDALGRRRGGVMYDRRRVRVVYVVTEPDVAQTLQYAEIERLRPLDNSIDGKRVDVVPVDVRDVLPENPPRDENERRGRAAVRKVLREHVDVWDAMERAELGTIGFRWVTRPNKQTGEVKGFKALIRRGRLKAAMMIPYVIARGRVRVTHGGRRARIEHRGYVAVLVLDVDDAPNVWVLTAWKEGKPDANR